VRSGHRFPSEDSEWLAPARPRWAATRVACRRMELRLRQESAHSREQLLSLLSDNEANRVQLLRSLSQLEELDNMESSSARTPDSGPASPTASQTAAGSSPSPLCSSLWPDYTGGSQRRGSGERRGSGGGGAVYGGSMGAVYATLAGQVPTVQGPTVQGVVHVGQSRSRLVEIGVPTIGSPGEFVRQRVRRRQQQRGGWIAGSTRQV
jgi:hypothetical protein